MLFFECLKETFSLPPTLRERMAFTEYMEIRYMLLHPFIWKNESGETNEELKTKTIHFTNGCAK